MPLNATSYLILEVLPVACISAWGTTWHGGLELGAVFEHGAPSSEVHHPVLPVCRNPRAYVGLWSSALPTFTLQKVVRGADEAVG